MGHVSSCPFGPLVRTEIASSSCSVFSPDSYCVCVFVLVFGTPRTALGQRDTCFQYHAAKVASLFDTTLDVPAKYEGNRAIAFLFVLSQSCLVFCPFVHQNQSYLYLYLYLSLQIIALINNYTSLTLPSLPIPLLSFLSLLQPLYSPFSPQHSHV